MPTIGFKGPDGAVYSVDAGEGESLMEAAVRNNVPGIIGECGGDMSCATCHVYIDERWAAQLPPASEDEQDLLEMSDARKPESRLGCQVKVSAALDGLVAQVVAE